MASRVSEITFCKSPLFVNALYSQEVTSYKRTLRVFIVLFQTGCSGALAKQSVECCVVKAVEIAFELLRAG